MTKKKRILVGIALGLALVVGGVGYSKWQTAQDFRAYINSRQWVEARKDYSSFSEVEVADGVIHIKDESINSRGGEWSPNALRIVESTQSGLGATGLSLEHLMVPDEEGVELVPTITRVNPSPLRYDIKNGLYWVNPLEERLFLQEMQEDTVWDLKQTLETEGIAVQVMFDYAQQRIYLDLVGDPDTVVDLAADAISRAGLETVEKERYQDANGNGALAMTLRFPR